MKIPGEVRGTIRGALYGLYIPLSSFVAEERKYFQHLSDKQKDKVNKKTGLTRRQSLELDERNLRRINEAIAWVENETQSMEEDK